MARIEGGGLGPKPRVLYQDAAQLETLRSKMDQATAKAPPRVRFARGIFQSLVSRAGRTDPMVPGPALPSHRSSRMDAREMQAQVRTLLQRHGRLHEVGKQDKSAQGRMLATLQGLLEARDRLEVRLTQLTRT